MNIKYIIKICISLGILYVLFESIEIHSLAGTLATADLTILSIAFGFVLSIRFIMTYRWLIVLRLYGIFPKFFNLLSIIFISNSVGHLLPAGIGVDVIRSYHLSKEEGKTSDIAASVFVDRIIGLVSMLGIALFSSTIGYFSNDISAVYSLVTTGILAVLFVLYSVRGKINIEKYDGLVKNRWLAFVLRMVGKFFNSLNGTPVPRATVFKLLLLSTSVQIVRIVIFMLIFSAIGVEAELLLFMVFIPLLFIIMLMPVSIGGLGVRESALYLFFGPYGISIEASIAAGLLFHILQIISLLPGLALFLLRTNQPTAKTEGHK